MSSSQNVFRPGFTRRHRQFFVRCSGPLLALLLLAAPGAAAAQAAQAAAGTQLQALLWTNPALERSSQDLAALEEEVGRQLGFSARIDPSLLYRDYPGDGAAGEITPRLTASARLDFGERPSTRIRSLQRLERARRAHRQLRVRSVRDALLAHGNLLVAQVQLESARVALQEAGSTHETEGTRESELGLRSARLDFEAAGRTLDAAAREAQSFGLPARVQYLSVRLALPEEASYDASFDYRLLELEVRLAQAVLAEARRSPLDDLRLRGQYRTRGGQYGAEGGLVNGNPAVTFDLSFPGGLHRWEVELSAQLVLDDSGRQLPGLELAVERAREALEGYPEEFARSFEAALLDARHAREALAIAEQELELLREAVPVAGNPERAQRSVRSAEVRLYRAWMTYVRAVSSLLELAGGEWRTL